MYDVKTVSGEGGGGEAANGSLLKVLNCCIRKNISLTTIDVSSETETEM